MLLTLITFALMMGLTGGPHCLVMCGPACSLLTQPISNNSTIRPKVLFFTGRALGYGAIGALAAISMQTLGWLSTQSTLFRPLWNLTHVLAMVLGLFLLIFANQPLWLGEVAKTLWKKIELHIALHPMFKKPWAIFVIGSFWSFLPCGLLYSVLMLAALSANALHGALVMFSFSIGGALFMGVGAQLFERLCSGRQRTHQPQAQIGLHPIRLKIHQQPLVTSVKPVYLELGVRLAGLALSVNSGWILYHDLILNQAPWCIPSP
jgi:hypothetical protein